MKKIILIILTVFTLISCTTYIETLDNVEILAIPSQTSLTIDPSGVQSPFYINLSLTSQTLRADLVKYQISYNEDSSKIAREGNFITLTLDKPEQKYFVSLMTKEAFETLKTNKMVTANVRLFFKTTGDIEITRDVQIPILYTEEVKPSDDK